MNRQTGQQHIGQREARTLPASILASILAFTASVATAGELNVQAPVVDVEPIKAAATSVEYCADKPVNGTLSQILAWDLGLNCREERVESSAITGYRVFYRWDDRVYSQVMAAAPGATIPLTVRLD